MKNQLLLILWSLSAVVATAQTNYALSFNGTTDYVSIGAPIPNNSSYTKEIWVYQTSASGSQNLISSSNAPFWISSGTLQAGQGGNFSLVTDPTAFPINRWVYLAVTYDAPSTTMKLYRDGLLISTNTTVPAYAIENTFIGSHQGGASLFQGSIDEIRIWNTALTSSQLKNDMFKGPAANATGLVAYYTCNDGSGTTLTSSCTNTSGLDGLINGSPAWIASPIQYAANALSFDGIDDVVVIPAAGSLDITTAITLEAWVYPTKNSGVQNVINKSGNAANTGYIFPRTDDGWAHAVIYLHIGGWRTLSAVYPSLNAWHHLAATYDGATIKLYIDGVLSASQAQTGTITTNSNPLTLGNQTGFSEYFGGSADEFRVWNVARTQAQIQAGMNTEIDPLTQTGLVSYYTANQGVAGGANTGMITVIDQTGTNNATLTNFASSGAVSNFVVQNGAITLPVTLLSFTAQSTALGVALNWTTASEENSRNFVVRHSTGVDWETIGTVAAAGNSNTVRNYSFLHTAPASGINYYRLLQVDLDDRSTYSRTLTASFHAAPPSFLILNNPAVNGMLQVRLLNPALLSFYNTEGRKLWQKHAAPGTELINVSTLAKGVYFLKGNLQTEKIIVH